VAHEDGVQAGREKNNPVFAPSHGEHSHRAERPLEGAVAGALKAVQLEAGHDARKKDRAESRDESSANGDKDDDSKSDISQSAISISGAQQEKTTKDSKAGDSQPRLSNGRDNAKSPLSPPASDQRSHSRSRSRGGGSREGMQKDEMEALLSEVRGHLGTNSSVASLVAVN
jgi:hypothetical protein